LIHFFKRYFICSHTMRLVWLVMAAFLSCVCSAQDQQSVSILNNRNQVESIARNTHSSLRIFCTEDVEPSLLHFWASSSVYVSHPGDDFLSFTGDNSSSIFSQHIQYPTSSVPVTESWKSNVFQMDPFHSSCVGILTKEPYTITYSWLHISYHRLLASILGVFLYYTASRLRGICIIQYTVQFLGLAILVLSSPCRLYSVSLALVLICWAAAPKWCKVKTGKHMANSVWRPKVKLLSEAEFQQQSNQETRKALEDLRKYCLSPSTNPWETVSKLSTPDRFAKFVGGSSHLTENEVMEYSMWESDGAKEGDEEMRDSGQY